MIKFSRPLQSYTCPDVRLRVQNGLPEVISIEDSKEFAMEVPESIVRPEFFEYESRRNHASLLPGNDQCISINKLNYFIFFFKDK